MKVVREFGQSGRCLLNVLDLLACHVVWRRKATVNGKPTCSHLIIGL